MSEDTHKKLVTFLTEEVAREKNRTLTKLDLACCTPGMRGTPLQTWDREEKPEVFEGQAQVEALVSAILSIAEDFARDLGGVQRFELRTTQALGGTRKISFRIESELGGDEGQSLTEPPNATGLTSQLMRHLEMKEQTMMRMLQATLGTMSTMVRDLADENQRARRDRTAWLAELEASRTSQQQREIDMLHQASVIDRKDKLFAQVTGLLPVVASRFATGSEDATEQAKFASVKAMLAQLGGSLSDDQKMKIAATLRPDQAALLMETFRVVEQNSDGAKTS